MSYRVVKFQQTPNPNALKVILDRPLPEPIRSFRHAVDAEGDALGEALFALPGVTGVLLSGPWLTVNKSPAAAWTAIRRGVERVLSATA